MQRDPVYGARGVTGATHDHVDLLFADTVFQLEQEFEFVGDPRLFRCLRLDVQIDVAVASAIVDARAEQPHDAARAEALPRAIANRLDFVAGQSRGFIFCIRASLRKKIRGGSVCDRRSRARATCAKYDRMPPENHGVRKTTFISVSTMDEIPVLSEAECAHMLESLAGAEADAAAGRGRLFDADVFVEEAMKRWATFKMKTAR